MENVKFILRKVESRLRSLRVLNLACDFKEGNTHIMPVQRKLNPAVMIRLHAAIHRAQSEFISTSDIKTRRPKKRRDHPIPSSSILCALCKEWIMGPTQPGSDTVAPTVREHVPAHAICVTEKALV